MKRAEILHQTETCICGQRECDYGKPEDNFKNIAKLWTAYKDIEFTTKDVAIMMALMKVARMKAGTKLDSAIDCCGYIAIAGEIMTAEKPEE